MRSAYWLAATVAAIAATPVIIMILPAYAFNAAVLVCMLVVGYLALRTYETWGPTPNDRQ